MLVVTVGSLEDALGDDDSGAVQVFEESFRQMQKQGGETFAAFETRKAAAWNSQTIAPVPAVVPPRSAVRFHRQ